MKKIAVLSKDSIPVDYSIDDRLVFYVNPQNNAIAEKYIRSNYYRIKREMKVQGFELVYGPYLRLNIGDKVAGYMTGIPYAAISNESVLGLFPEDITCQITEACFIRFSVSENGYVLYSLAEEDEYTDYVKNSIRGLQKNRQGMLTPKGLFLDDSVLPSNLHEKVHKHKVTKKITDKKSSLPDRSNDIAIVCHHSIELTVQLADEDACSGNVQEVSDEELDFLQGLDNETIIRKMRKQLLVLQQRGFTKETLTKLLAPRMRLSRMTITRDYRIILNDYVDMEIKLSAKYKAFYFLFLRHPEGINYSCMVDYSAELFSIYRRISPRYDTEKLRNSAYDIASYESNEKNVCASHIKKEFLSKLDDSIASVYFIRGKQGEDKKIELDRKLVTWECRL